MSERPTGHTEAQGTEREHGAREVMSAARERAGEATQKLRQEAAGVAEAGKDRLAAEAEQRRDVAAREARTLSNALHNAVSELAEGDSILTTPMRQLAETCEDLADKLEGKDSRQLLAELEDMGRRQPGGFFVAAVALGFIGVRFLRAGAEEPSRTGRETHRETHREPHHEGHHAPESLAPDPCDEQPIVGSVGTTPTTPTAPMTRPPWGHVRNPEE